MQDLTPLLAFSAAHAIAMLLLYVAARVSGNHAIVDPGWSLGVAAGVVVLTPEWTTRTLLLNATILFWAARLSYYLIRSRVLTRRKDRRYERMEASLGPRAPGAFLLLFLAQTPLVVLFLVPWLIALNAASALRSIDLFAAALGMLAIAGEAIADQQLAAHRRIKTSPPTVCTRGLWRYSRHPNYFFEWLHWTAYVLFSLGSSSWALSLVGPLAMYLFLTRISGIPHLEREALRSRGEAYLAYQQTTNRFWPWIPHPPH